MSKLNFALALNLATALALAQQIPQDSSAATFRSQSDLVLVPFHVARAGQYVSNLKAADALCHYAVKLFVQGPSALGRITP
jgi:hypothetical protein